MAIRKREDSDSRRRDLLTIHTAVKQLGLDENTYRSMLKTIAGVESATELSPQDRGKVLQHLRQAGYLPGKSSSAYPGLGRPDLDSLFGTGKYALMKQIEARLTEAKKTWIYAHVLARHMFQVERIQWCTPQQLNRVLTALEYDAGRRGRPVANQGKNRPKGSARHDEK